MKKRHLLLIFSFLWIFNPALSCGVTAGFTPTGTNVCTGDIINFTNTTTGATTYTWHLDEFTFSTQTNALLSFGSAGVYSIELIADDGAGCLDSITIDITVSQASNAGSDNSAIFCNSDDSIDLNGMLNGSLTGFWNEVTTSGQFNSTTGFLDYYQLPESEYYFNYVVPGVGACPNDTAQIEIEINQEPFLSFNFSNINIDISDSLFVDYDTIGVFNSATYVWNFCDGNFATNNSPFYNQWDIPGTYCVCVQVNNGNNCVETFCDSMIVVFDQSSMSEFEKPKVITFPNPTVDFVTISFENGPSYTELYLLDAQGNLLNVFNFEPSVKIDLRPYAKGAYWLTYMVDNVRESKQLFRN